MSLVLPFRSPPKKQKIGDLKSMLDGSNQTESITDDSVAAFLQAGISVNKVDHPSIRGLIQKYTKVSSFVRFGNLSFFQFRSLGR